jgi:hypothetical protein
VKAEEELATRFYGIGYRHPRLNVMSLQALEGSLSIPAVDSKIGAAVVAPPHFRLTIIGS